jgi:cobyrinic acid a,c-diamide synthase
MYLARTLTDFDGRVHALAGLLPCDVAMENRRMALGYVELEVERDNLLTRAGETLRGHEFHWSRLAAGAEQANAYRLLGSAPRREGFALERILASYVHLHFGSRPDLAPRFVEAMG